MTGTRAAAALNLVQHHACCECDPDTLESPWKAELCAVLHARDEAERRRRLDGFFDVQMPDVRRVLARVKRVARMQWEDDDVALSYFGQALLRMVNQRWRAKDGPGTSPVFNYSSNLPMILEAETRSCIRDDRRLGLLDGTVGVPGGGAQDRKGAHVAKSRQLYEIEHGRAAADDELVDFHNDRMRATRKDAARQAVLISRDDLRPARVVLLDGASAEVEGRIAVPAVSEVGSLNWADRIEAVICRCWRLDREREACRARRLKRAPVLLVDVARAYFADHAIGEFPTRRELLERLGITEPAARRELSVRLREVLDVARDLFADYRRAH
ncbi:hypothetical protein ACIGH6_09240 [Brachybacterium paraconglomeratum]|uniref:hypothetical protein n=1 Tax=Brachybacterium paraconglomeratum TaxID=173362 RepID=UPI0037CACF40